jgi:hypothetical protein
MLLLNNVHEAIRNYTGLAFGTVHDEQLIRTLAEVNEEAQVEDNFH